MKMQGDNFIVGSDFAGAGGGNLPAEPQIAAGEVQGRNRLRLRRKY